VDNEKPANAGEMQVIRYEKGSKITAP